jgi:serine-type D-Ala-D-Ala carboxypeptidase/endopeptidase
LGIRRLCRHRRLAFERTGHAALRRAILAGRQGPLGAAAERLVEPLARFDSDIGYAVFLRGPPARRTWTHNGATGGYRTELLMAPDMGEVIILMASNANASVGSLSAQLMASRYPVEPGTAQVDVAHLADYSGVFRIHATAAFTCVLQDGVLYLRGPGQIFEPLRASTADEFTLGTRGRVVFARDGVRVVGLTLSARGIDSIARRADEPLPARAIWPEAQLRPYAGRYKLAGMDFDVQVRAGQLTARLNSQPRLAVFAVPGQDDRFAYDVVRAELQFERDANGTVQALVLHQNGQQRVPKVQ